MFNDEKERLTKFPTPLEEIVPSDSLHIQPPEQVTVVAGPGPTVEYVPAPHLVDSTSPVAAE